MGNASHSDIEKFMQNALKDRFNSNCISWASDDDKRDYAQTCINILTKSSIERDFVSKMNTF